MREVLSLPLSVRMDESVQPWQRRKNAWSSLPAMNRRRLDLMTPSSISSDGSLVPLQLDLMKSLALSFFLYLEPTLCPSISKVGQKRDHPYTWSWQVIKGIYSGTLNYREGLYADFNRGICMLNLTVSSCIIQAIRTRHEADWQSRQEKHLRAYYRYHILNIVMEKSRLVQRLSKRRYSSKTRTRLHLSAQQILLTGRGKIFCENTMPTSNLAGIRRSASELAPAFGPTKLIQWRTLRTAALPNSEQCWYLEIKHTSKSYFYSTVFATQILEEAK